MLTNPPTPPRDTCQGSPEWLLHWVPSVAKGDHLWRLIAVDGPWIPIFSNFGRPTSATETIKWHESCHVPAEDRLFIFTLPKLSLYLYDTVLSLAWPPFPVDLWRGRKRGWLQGTCEIIL